VVGNGSTITLSANGLNQPITVTLLAMYVGTGTANMSGQPQLVGSPQFSLSTLMGTTLRPGATASLAITFNPTATRQASAQIILPYTETTATTTSSGSIELNLNGTAPNFAVTYFFQNNNIIQLNDGGTLSFPPTPVKTTSTVGVAIQNLGSGPGPINSVTVTGAAFQVVGLPLLPGSVNSAAALQFTIQYTPTMAQMDQGTFQVVFPDHTVNVTLTGSGTAANFALTYLFQSNQNVIQVNNGGTLPFPPTPVKTTSTAGVAIQNLGSGPGLINSVTVTGTAFQVVGLPLLPATVNSAVALQFTIQYTPTLAQMDQGTLQVVFPDHTVSVTLTGSGTTPIFSYQLIQNGRTTGIAPGQTVIIPAVNVGSSGAFSIVVQNTGNGPGTINGLSLVGTGFQVVNPVTFPQTLAPGASISLSFSFTPPQTGQFTGQLQIGSDTFVLAGQAGPALAYSYSTSAGVTAVQGGGSVIFSPIQLSQNSNTVFSIQNVGIAPASVTSISLAQSKTAFTLSGLPALPLTLAPNASASFTIVFSPAAVGQNTATLQIDTQSFTLSGAGDTPPPLPSFQFTGASGTQQPLQQPSIGLTLASPYSLPLTGTLTLAEIPGAFSADPAVQFGTGGQTVSFTIAPNTLQAVFPNGSTSIKLQTGSVSGTITVTPDFTTSGGFDLTPANPATVSFTVPAGPPQLLSAQVAALSATGFTLSLTGVSTSRALTAVNLMFTVASGFALNTTQISMDITSAASAWFLSSQSTAFGGQFTISVPFTLTAGTGTAMPISAIQSVSATIANALGTSSSITTPVQ
jgi:hypothetical protein